MVRIKSQAGLSIVEIMIASVLGLILVLGISQLFVGSSDTFRLAEAISRMQESGRMSHEILGRAVRNADYWGCITHGSVESLVNADGDTFLEFDPDDGSAIELEVADGSGNSVANSVVIRVKGADSLGLSLSRSMNNAGDTLDITTNTDMGAADLEPTLIADCTDGTIFVPSDIESTANAEPNAGTFTTVYEHEGADYASLSKAFTSGDLLRPFVREYRLQSTGGRFALVLEDVDNTVELISDVIDMRVQAGTGTIGSTTVNSWTEVTSGSVGTINMATVKALRISLLVRSANDGISQTSQSVCFPAWTDCSGGNNWNAGANDRHLYRVYTSTYSIRNRLLERS